MSRNLTPRMSSAELRPLYENSGLVFTNMEEVWKDVDGWNGLYQVSSLGRVKSVKRARIRRNGRPYQTKERILSQSRIYGGYLRVGLTEPNTGKSITPLVATLVCSAFHGKKPGPKYEVDHINTIRTDNRADNLRWVENRRENMNNPISIERCLPYRRNRKDQSKEVYQYDKISKKFLCFYPSVCEASRKTGVNCGQIAACCRGVWKTAGGFIWRYANKDEITEQTE